MGNKLLCFQKLADLTGSRAYERFTGHQIAKILAQKAESYFNTEVFSYNQLKLIDMLTLIKFNSTENIVGE